MNLNFYLPSEEAEAVNEAVELLSSAHMIASRAGKETNWSGFDKSVLACLAKFNRNGNTARTYRAIKEEPETSN